MGTELFRMQQIKRRQQEVDAVTNAAVQNILSRRPQTPRPANWEAQPQAQAAPPSQVEELTPLQAGGRAMGNAAMGIVQNLNPIESWGGNPNGIGANLAKGVGVGANALAAGVTIPAAYASKAMGLRDETEAAVNDITNVGRYLTGNELKEGLSDKFMSGAQGSSAELGDALYNPDKSWLDVAKAGGKTLLQGGAVFADPFGLPGAGKVASKVAPVVEQVGRNVARNVPAMVKATAAERGLKTPMDFINAAAKDDAGAMVLEKTLAAGMQGPPERVPVEGLPEDVKQSLVEGDVRGAAEKSDIPLEVLKKIKDTDVPLHRREATLEKEPELLATLKDEQTAEKWARNQRAPVRLETQQDGSVKAFKALDTQRERAMTEGYDALLEDLRRGKAREETGEDIRTQRTKVHSPEGPQYKPNDEPLSIEDTLSAMREPTPEELASMRQRNKTKRSAKQAPLVNKTPAPKEVVEPEPIGPMKYVARKTDPVPEPVEYAPPPRRGGILDETERQPIPPEGPIPLQEEGGLPPGVLYDDYFPPAGEVPVARKSEPIGPMKFFPPKGEVPLATERPPTEARIPLAHDTRGPIPLEQPPKMPEEPRIPLQGDTYPLSKEGYKTPVDYIGERQPISHDPKAKARPPVSVPLGEVLPGKKNKVKPFGVEARATAKSRPKLEGIKLNDPTVPPPPEIPAGAGRKPPGDDSNYLTKPSDGGMMGVTFKGNLWQLMFKTFLSDRRTLKALGRHGAETAKRIDTRDSILATNYGGAASEMGELIAPLTKEERINAGKVMFGKEPAMNERVAAAANYAKAYIEDVAERGKQTLSRFRERKDYGMPLRPTEEYQAMLREQGDVAFLEKMMKQSNGRIKTLEEAQDWYQQAIRPYAERVYKNLEAPRNNAIPEEFIEYDIGKVMFDYAWGAEKRFADAKMFGENDEILGDIYANAARNGDDVTTIRQIADKAIKGDPNTQAHIRAEAISGGLRAIQSIQHLGTLAVTNLGDLAMPWAREGFWNTLRAIPAAMSKSGARGAANSGVLRHDLDKALKAQGETDLAHTIMKVTAPGADATDYLFRKTATIASQYKAKNLLDKAIQGNKRAEDMLKRKYLDPDGVDEAIKAGQFTDKQLGRIGHTGISASQPVRTLDSPNFSKNPIGKVLYQFRRHMLHRADQVWDNMLNEIGVFIKSNGKLGDPRQIVGYMVASVILGEPIADFNAWLYGDERPGILENPLRRMAENFFVAGAGGAGYMMLDALSRGGTGESLFWNIFGSPTGGDLADMVDVARADDKKKALTKFALSNTPLVSSTVAPTIKDKLYPEDKKKRTHRFRPLPAGIEQAVGFFEPNPKKFKAKPRRSRRATNRRRRRSRR